MKTLYSLVTEAIRKTEVLEDLGAPGARSAYLDVSLLEERIASLLSASCNEGAIARRGAVGAAVDAHEFARAKALAARFALEIDAGDALKRDLADLAAEVDAAVTRESRLQETQYPRAYARYGAVEIRRFADQFYRQGAPLPIG